jgi:gliding motility-associated-like protein
MKKAILFLLFFIFYSSFSFATHNRAGEITYRYISGFEYEITITTYTKTSSAAADRCELSLSFGDGTSAIVPRINGGPGLGCNHQGEALPNDVKLNHYRIRHTYPSTGVYKLKMNDPNRNQDVLNIPSSINEVFALESVIVISANATNSSPVLTNPPVDRGCLRQPYEHNPGAVDQDIINGRSDSLAYSLVACLGRDGLPIPGFQLPDQISPGPLNRIWIDSTTGTLHWEAPMRSGEYNVAILIEEYRTMQNGSVIFVGSVLRDLQITIHDCNNNAPIINIPSDTCVVAVSIINRTISATDPDNFNEVIISATGDPFLVSGNQAVFPRTTGIGTVTSNFVWESECLHIRQKPYNVIFRAQDDNPFNPTHIRLSKYEVWRIQVIGPAPENCTINPQGSSLRINWDYSICDNQIGFKIYRRIDSSGFVPSVCETGVPNTIGYSLLTTLNDGNARQFIDDNNGSGLVHGRQYCYLIIAYFQDGSESIVSSEVCGNLRKEVPIITRVSINQTGLVNGNDSVEWSAPTELDQSVFPGPYHYKILRRAQLSNFSFIAQTNSSNDLFLVDTVFVDSNLNTLDLQYTYRIDLYSGEILAGSSPLASSIFLNPQGLDNRIVLTWDENVPWTNEKYVIYRKNISGIFEVIDTTNNQPYIDFGLANEAEFCYKILTIGEYNSDGFKNPILNYSQEICAMPQDTEAPCPPVVSEIDSKCELYVNKLTWLNPNDICSTTNDVVGYKIYYKPTLNGNYSLIRTLSGAENTTSIFEELESVAGCYYITAIDSFNNESEPSNEVCVDNCPIYILPNVFTPGGDGLNDELTPFPYRYVEKIDLYVYNRWGELVFETNDPRIAWDGSHKNTGGFVPDGVYFYECTVYEIRLSGLIPRVLKGNVTIFRQTEQFPNQ